MPFLGSSPHTRGARPLPRPRGVGRRIIPAYAGSTLPEGPRQGADADHPRIRGEHASRALTRNIVPGSSPHTRGARPVQPRPGSAARIIPAYAGSTRFRRRRRERFRDHPRIRGEHRHVRVTGVGACGSSPHTRGAHDGAQLGRCSIRIIPAYAGSTKIAQKGKGMAADHPRIRGEHCCAEMLFAAFQGSSPHTRGALLTLPRRRRLLRIIPAYAGSTPALSASAPPRPDHPRIRGEHPCRCCR